MATMLHLVKVGLRRLAARSRDRDLLKEVMHAVAVNDRQHEREAERLRRRFAELLLARKNG